MYERQINERPVDVKCISYFQFMYQKSCASNTQFSS